MKSIGVIGGLGPMASVYYLKLLVEMTKADKDQEYPRIYMECLPDIPDRTKYILGESTDSPYPMLMKAAKELEAIGADVITIPCITSYCFYKKIQDGVKIPIINLPEEIVKHLIEHNVRSVGIMATTGTVKCGILEDECKKCGISVLLPEEKVQGMVMDIIYKQIKRGRAVDWKMVDEVMTYFIERGADKIILGCTELPLLKGMLYEGIRDTDSCEYSVMNRLYKDCEDVLEILAKMALKFSGVRIKENRHRTEIVRKEIVNL